MSPIATFLLVPAGALAALAGIGHVIHWRRLPRTPADVALVFGCGQRWKAESRLQAALALYRAGLVRHVIVSGGVPMPGDGRTEAAWFREWLVDAGVPAAVVSEEVRATNTAENVEFALPIIEAAGFRRVALVMSDFEAIRAHLTARRAWRGRGLTIYDAHGSSGYRWNRWTWWRSREGWALTWYTLPRLFRYRLLPYLWRR
jgi:uncharacterized SAM-binding protein YcdF (DUF218 family)